MPYKLTIEDVTVGTRGTRVEFYLHQRDAEARAHAVIIEATPFLPVRTILRPNGAIRFFQYFGTRVVTIEPIEARHVPAAPAVFVGWQPTWPPGQPPLALWNLTAALPDHPVGSTVVTSTLEAAGYRVQEPAYGD